jgi:hypothetical protein
MERTGGSSSNDDAPPGAPASFPYDRTTVERFRKSFPRARWSDELKAWFVPGKTAARRFSRWLEQELAGSSVYADSRGRDAYAFDPIVSKYLLVHQDRLEVQTPYSRSVVNMMRDVPFASWDSDRRAWTVPFRSYEQLHRRWAEIEAAALRNEPDGDILGSQYADFPDHHDYVWGRWRPAALDELIKTWPSRTKTKIGDALWWQPTLDDLRVARRAARGLERRRRRV